MSSSQPSLQDDGGGHPPPPPSSPASQSTKAQKDGSTAAKKYKTCNHPSDCKKRSFLRGLCFTHLDREKCTQAGCRTLAHPAGKGKCSTHRADRQKCAQAGCNTLALPAGKGKCATHRADRKKCAQAGCNTLAHPAGKGKCATHRERRERRKRKTCDVEACTSVAVAGGKCVVHNKTQCVHTDNDEQCTKFAVYRRTQCSGHMPRKQCRHGEDDTAAQCKAAANSGTFFCGVHRRGERAAAAAAAAASKMKSGGTVPKGDAGKTDGGKRNSSTADTGAGPKRIRSGAHGGWTATEQEVVELFANSMPSVTADTVTTALATAGRNAAGRCLVSTCFLSSRGHFLCREHSGLYRCTAQTANGEACEILTSSTSVRRTCTAHSKIESAEKMVQGGSTHGSGESTRSDIGGGSSSGGGAAAPIPKRQAGVTLVACAFSSDTGVKCNRNGDHGGVDIGKPYCKRHYIFTHLRTTLTALERDKALDLTRLPVHEASQVTDEKMDWCAAVANKLGHLKPDGTIRV